MKAKSIPTPKPVPLKEGEKLLLIRPGRHYRLGGQMDEVFGSHVLAEVVEVFWDHHAQEWERV